MNMIIRRWLTYEWKHPKRSKCVWIAWITLGLIYFSKHIIFSIPFLRFNLASFRMVIFTTKTLLSSLNSKPARLFNRSNKLDWELWLWFGGWWAVCAAVRGTSVCLNLYLILLDSVYINFCFCFCILIYRWYFLAQCKWHLQRGPGDHAFFLPKNATLSRMNLLFFEL